MALVACRPPEQQGQGRGAAAAQDGLRLRVEFGATTVGPAGATVHLLDGDEGVSGASVELQGDMTHAGMQPVIATAAETEPGVYRAADFAFNMAGDWIVTVSVETADGRKASSESFVTVASR